MSEVFFKKCVLVCKIFEIDALRKQTRGNLLYRIPFYLMLCSVRTMKTVRLENAAELIDTGFGTDPDALLREKKTNHALRIL